MSNVGNICYPCKKETLINGICRLCGAQRQINESTGNIIWVRNGKLVAAFDDEKSAYIVMATENNIPPEHWPKKYRGE